MLEYSLSDSEEENYKGKNKISSYKKEKSTMYLPSYKKKKKNQK